MKKFMFFCNNDITGASVVSCSSGDDDDTPSLVLHKNLTKADGADRYNADGKNKYSCNN